MGLIIWKNWLSFWGWFYNFNGNNGFDYDEYDDHDDDENVGWTVYGTSISTPLSRDSWAAWRQIPSKLLFTMRRRRMVMKMMMRMILMQRCKTQFKSHKCKVVPNKISMEFASVNQQWGNCQNVAHKIQVVGIASLPTYIRCWNDRRKVQGASLTAVVHDRDLICIIRDNCFARKS